MFWRRSKAKCVAHVWFYDRQDKRVCKDCRRAEWGHVDAISGAEWWRTWP